MDSLKRADIKGRRVRVTDDSGCKFVGSVEYVDYQRGKMGVTGAVEGYSKGKSLQIFFRSDIRKIVVFEDTPAVFAQMPSTIDVSKRMSAPHINKQTNITKPSYVLVPGGAEYRGGKHRPLATLGSAGETSDSSDKGRSSGGIPSSPTFATPDSQAMVGAGSDLGLVSGIPSTPDSQAGVVPKSDSSLLSASGYVSGIAPTRHQPTPVYASVSAGISPPSQVMSSVTTSTQAIAAIGRSNHHPNTSFLPPVIPSSLPASFSLVSDPSGYPCYPIPSVVTVPNLPVRDRERLLLTKGVKELLWPSPSSPPIFTTPCRLYYVEREGDLFEEAVVRLSSCTRIGVSMEGQVLGRNGKTSLLVISSQEEVFVFDLLAMGENAFKWGLYTVLGNKEVVKVMHDCRQISDTLYHQYGLELENIFDTLAGHLVFSNWVLQGEQRVAKHLDYTVKDYLGVPDEHLYTTHYSSSTLKSDTSIWLARPLPDHLLRGAARNCMYLLALAGIMERAVQLPVERAMQAMMSSSTTSDKEVARQMVLTPQYLPSEVLSSLPRWKYEDSTSRG
eukprot:GFUD01003893.1.p1 GENE.GFUD01003893.1~~GFUD01003893.1.p1  ORF type:complete len:558 (-),score=213.06 GFUD01003893.1:414-2087(-)